MQKTLYIPIDTTLNYEFECPLLVKKYDTLKFKFAIFSLGILQDLNGQTVDLILYKKDGTTIQKTITNTTLNIATIILDKNASACIGEVLGEIVITDAGGQVTSNIFKFNVSNSLTEDIEIKSKDDITTIEDMRALIATYKNEISAIGESTQAVEALNNITTYIDTNLSELTSKNAAAVKNVTDLKKENDRADTNIPGLTNLNDTAEEKLQEFREFDTSNIVTTLRDHGSQLNENTQELETVKTDYAKKTEVNTLASNKADKTELETANTNISKNATELLVQKSRIDSFTKLTEGSTTGDAELIDARIGENGVIYNSLGTAIREQNENKTSALYNNGIIKKINFTYERGSIAGDTGLDENSSWNCRTDSYQVTKSGWYRFIFNSDYNVYAYFFDENGTFAGRSIDIKSGDDLFVKKGSIRLVVLSKNQSTKVDLIVCSREFFIYERTVGYDYIIDKHMYIESWSQGSLSSTTGLAETQNKVIKSSHIRIDEELTLNVEMPTNYYVRVYYYSLENKFLGCDNWISSKDSLNLKIKNNVYIRLLIRTSTWDDITTEILKNINIYIPSGCKINEKQKDNNTSKYNKIISNMIKTGLETGITVSPTKHLGVITGCPDVDSDGNVYVGLEACDDTAYESSETAYAELITFNIIHPEDYEVYEVIKDGDILNYTNPFFGYTETVKFAWDTIAMKINKTTVRVLTKVRTNTTAQYLVYRDFSIDNKTFGDINVLKAKTSNGDIVMWGNNNEIIRNSYNLTEIDTSGDNYFLLFNCRIERVVLNDILYYYSFIGFGFKSHPLMRSTDLETWEYVSEFPIGFPTDEVQVALYNNKLYCVNRARWNYQNDIYINEFDLSTNSWLRKLSLYKEIHGQEKPAIVVRENYMYLTVCDGYDNKFDGHVLPRTKKRFYKVNLDTMVQEKQILVEPDIPLVYPEFFKVGGAIYVMSCMDRRAYYMDKSDGRQELSLSYFNYSLLDLIEN